MNIERIKKIVRNSRKLMPSYRFSDEYSKFNRVNIFDYNYNIRDYNKNEFDYARTNGYYSSEYIIRRFCNYYGKFNVGIEHGIGLGCKGAKQEVHSSYPLYFVASRERAITLSTQFSDRLFIPIGPIIAYARVLFDEYTMNDIRMNLGKTLLVFPQHNTVYSHLKMRNSEFIDYVKEIKEKGNYDTILVCVYYLDIIRGAHIPYEKENWTVVTCGGKDSSQFMDFQKTIISLSDAAVVENMSSAFFYCSYFDIPTYVNGNIDLFEDEIRRFSQEYSPDEYECTDFDTIRDFYYSFSGNKMNTCSTKELLEKWGGKSYVKEPEDLVQILKFARNVRAGMSLGKIKRRCERIESSKVKEVVKDSISRYCGN